MSERQLQIGGVARAHVLVGRPLTEDDEQRRYAVDRDVTAALARSEDLTAVRGRR